MVALESLSTFAIARTTAPRLTAQDRATFNLTGPIREAFASRENIVGANVRSGRWVHGLPPLGGAFYALWERQESSVPPDRQTPSLGRLYAACAVSGLACGMARASAVVYQTPTR
jgi:hypothetical protein